jgi:general secretion pathway protein C
MKRLPLVASFVLFIVLCASAAYWAMQLFKPPVRPVAAPPRAARPEVRPEAAAGLFGGRGSKAAVASNYQLRGVIVSGNGRDSVAILSADGKPAQAIRINTEVVPGVMIKEVHREYVLLSEDGVTKRVELPESAKGQVNVGGAAAPAPTVPAQPPLTRPPPVVAPPSTTLVNPPQPGAVNPGNSAPPANSTANPPPSPEPAPPASPVPGSAPGAGSSSGR